ncbi:sugar transferase [Bacillus sp. JCM 19041]|uniref:sugar transferase n=1 Tax=Bacillus sp. JCM 19041 TaxID=1460637 RepID=UPI000AC898E4
MDMDIAVALFVYNRPKHTEVVLKGLKENGVSELYVFIDGLKDKQHEKDHQQVNALIKEINWCTTYVVRQPQNIGLAISIITGVTRLTETHEAVIVLEDDCVPKEGFVSFMKKALHYYEDVPEVMHVSGFGLPLKKKYTNADVYFSPYPCSWGWGTWSKTWRSCDFNNEEAYRHLLNNEIEIYKFTAPGEAFKDFLQFQLDGKINSWLIRWYHHIFSQNGRCVWLYDSLIENQGFDGTGSIMLHLTAITRTLRLRLRCRNPNLRRTLFIIKV